MFPYCKTLESLISESSPPCCGWSQDPYKPVGTEDRALPCSAGLGDQQPASHVLTPATHDLLFCSLEGLKGSVLEPKSQDVLFSMPYTP